MFLRGKEIRGSLGYAHIGPTGYVLTAFISVPTWNDTAKSRLICCDSEKYSPIVERVSVDEGYIDVTPDDGLRIARQIRAEIKRHSASRSRRVSHIVISGQNGRRRE